MILREATIKYKGYDPDLLSYGSKKRICYSCNECGKVNWITKQNYNNSKYPNLCRSCSSKGERSYIFRNPKSNQIKEKISKTLSGKVLSKETIKKMIKNHPHKSGKDAPNWKGGFDKRRPWLSPINKCIQLNKKFEGLDFHHITKNVGIYIPVDTHKINHSIKNNKNMDKINEVALQYLIGDY